MGVFSEHSVYYYYIVLI